MNYINIPSHTRADKYTHRKETFCPKFDWDDYGVSSFQKSEDIPPILPRNIPQPTGLIYR